MKPQIFSLNLIRTVAIIMVIFDHSRCLDIDPDVNKFLGVLLGPDAALFFMISGALLLPVRGSVRDFLTKRLIRVFIPFVIWVIIYAVAYYLEGSISKPVLASSIRWSWINYDFYAGWFVPVIISSYFVLPILSPWIERARDSQYRYMFKLWALAGLVPWLAVFIGTRENANIFMYFTNAIPYFVAGYYILRKIEWGLWNDNAAVASASADATATAHSAQSRRHGARSATSRRKKAIWIAALLLVGIVIPYLLKTHTNTGCNSNAAADYRSINSIALGVLIFSLLIRVRTLTPPLNRAVNFLSRYSYGAYLCHCLFGAIIVHNHFPEVMDSTAQLFAVQFAGSFLLTWLLSKIPFLGRYIV